MECHSEFLVFAGHCGCCRAPSFATLQAQPYLAFNTADGANAMSLCNCWYRYLSLLLLCLLYSLHQGAAISLWNVQTALCGSRVMMPSDWKSGWVGLLPPKISNCNCKVFKGSQLQLEVQLLPVAVQLGCSSLAVGATEPANTSDANPLLMVPKPYPYEIAGATIYMWWEIPRTLQRSRVLMPMPC